MQVQFEALCWQIHSTTTDESRLLYPFQDSAGNGAVFVVVGASIWPDFNWTSGGALIHSSTAAVQNIGVYQFHNDMGIFS